MNQIGKYAIVGQIGTGGFGVVYEGRDPFLKRRVAIKTCNSEEPELRDRFFREAEIAGNLQHRNIVTVHDFGIQDGVPYLVQEYLTGEDLDRLVARREPLPAAQRVDILVQAARGLEYAHRHDVIHRDVKPANIRLTADGTVKIMDFGIAKLSNVASHLTRTGMALGTAAYLPPEQIRGTAVDHRADIFSFGVTAYELLSYKRPFGGKTISALFWELLQREPEPLAHHWPSCPPELEQVVSRCLAKEPQQRYAGFSELIPALEAALAELQRPGRGEEKTMQHPGVAPAPAGGAARPTPLPPTAAQPQRAAAPGKATPVAPAPAAAATPGAAGTKPTPAQAGPSVNERFDAVVTAARRVPPPPSAGLLGDVQEALAGANAADVARRARDLLARGELEAAERELAGLPAKAGPEVAAVRRDLARARADRALAQAAAQWQQGQPQAALLALDQLLASAPDHQDALRLRDSWRAELAERERARAEAADEANARRTAIAKAVAESEALLGRGDLDSAEAVVAAAQAHLGSHQPLRDLRRRIALARTAAPAAPPQAGPTGVRVSLDASTIGVGSSAVAAARQRVEAEGLRPTGDAAAGRVGTTGGGGAASAPAAARGGATAGAAPASGIAGIAWPRPDLPGPSYSAQQPANRPPAAPSPAGHPPVPTFADTDVGVSSAARTRLLLLVAGGVLLLIVIALLARWLLTRPGGPEAPAPTPTPVATASVASAQIGVGVQSGGSPTASATPRPADRNATLVQRAPAAFPSGVPRRRAVVMVEVLVGADGKPLSTRVAAGTAAHPRLVAEAQRAAQRSTYLPALRGGQPAESWLPVAVDFRPPP
jgi:serine/threonine-protein kinase